MTQEPRSPLNEVLLSLLLGAGNARESARRFQEGDWHELLRLAELNVVLLRVSMRLAEAGIEAPPFFLEAVSKERLRVEGAVELIARLCGLCAAHDIPFLLPKAFQHLPDMGHDIDLLVFERPEKADEFLVRDLGARRGGASLCERIAGKTSFDVPGFTSPVEVHHGRLGHLGEHHELAGALLRNRKEKPLGTAFAYVPSSEDHLLVQGLQRMYGHFRIRMGDLLCSLDLLREDLDWDYIRKAAVEAGLSEGLGCYLSYVEQICSPLMGESPLPGAALELARAAGCGAPRWEGSQYGFPRLRVIPKVYSAKLLSDFRRSNWESVARLCLLPFVALIVKSRDAAVRVISDGKGR